MTASMTAGLTFSQCAPEELPADVRELLYEVLYRDYGVTRDQEWLNAADGGHFFVARDGGGQLCGAGRLMPLAEATRARGPQVRQIATAPDARGRGVGMAVMEAIETAAVTQGATRLWLKARQQAWGFYVKRGYLFEGPEFTAGECLAEDGIFVSKLTGIPHKIMAKQL
ncbi:MAG: GNAT family N-acetyltransferase [Coriobacteriia bacterium]|nr:GNAT family N-acetyltransferase [Coriobacteriia bacterium]